MAEDLQAIVPVEDADARRELLARQLDDIDEVVPDVAPAPGRARDAGGRYVEGAAEPDAAPAEEPVWRRPPASWKKEQHEVWNAADPRMQEYAYHREEQMRAGIEPYEAKARFADQIHQAMEPYLPTIRQLGVQPHEAVQALMNADYRMRNGSENDRLAYFAHLAQQYGVDLTRAGNLLQQMPAVDPRLQSLQNELQTIRGEVSGWKEQQEQVQNQVLVEEINKFSQTVDHFEEARPAMIQLLQSGFATDLQDAYKKALRLDDSLFETTQRDRQSSVDATRRAATDRAAKSARAAAVSVRSSTPGAATTTKAQDRRSLLAEQFDSMSDRL